MGLLRLAPRLVSRECTRHLLAARRHYTEEVADKGAAAATLASGGQSKYVTIHVESADGTDRVPIRTRRYRRWTTEDRQKLLRLVAENKTELGVVDWGAVASQFPDLPTSKCKSTYWAILKQTGASTAVPHSKTADGDSVPLQGEGGLFDTIGRLTAAWSRDDDDLLLALCDLEGRRWSVVSRAMGKYTQAQCQARYTTLMKKRPPRCSDPSSAGDSTKIPGATSCRKTKKPKNTKRTDLYKYKPLKTPDSLLVWAKEEDERLRKLLIEHGKFDFIAIREHFPGFNYYNIYSALQRLAVEPGLVKGPWTNSEHRALLKLINQHGDNWQKIAESMPTGRTLGQCRAHYMTCCIKPVAKRGRWSKEEEEQLRHLVDICVKGQLSPEIVLQRHQKGTQSRPPSLDNINAAKFEMYGRFADALKKDNSSRLNSQGDSTAGAIVWPLISTYMGVRTASQCRLKWYYMQKNSSSDDGCEFYKGPWTRDEDATLYRLYRMNPGRWLWIHQGLPRRRKLISVKARYVTYVGRYVEMLRRCRPPGWDPMDDQFEEVHMRCEILAWHRGQLEGYRDSDPYESPYDLDLTGYSKWIKDTAS